MSSLGELGEEGVTQQGQVRQGRPRGPDERRAQSTGLSPAYNAL